ncbi:MAG: hypothetical protein V7707_05970 [Motiliproteus sp.]
MQNLKIDHWSKGVASFFAAASLIALPLSDHFVFLVCLGGFIFGVGEWINHPHQTKILAPSESGYPGWLKGQGCLRKNSFYGVSFATLGATIFVFGIFKLFYVTS